LATADNEPAELVAEVDQMIWAAFGLAVSEEVPRKMDYALSCEASRGGRRFGTVVLTALASNSKVAKVTLRSQRSTDPMYVRCSPH
jgi:hypothetical protein